MITIKAFGKAVMLSNADWANIKKRFNYASVDVRDEYRRYIHIPCSLCKKHYRGRRKPSTRCDECPLHVFHTGRTQSEGCMRLLNSFADTYVVIVNTDEIYWELLHDKWAKNYLDKLQAAMKRVEAENTHDFKEVLHSDGV